MITKTHFLGDVKDGDRFDDVFILESIQEKLTKANKPYLIVALRDKTGSASGKVWEVPTDAVLKPKTYVKVRVEVGTYNGALDLNIKKIKPLDDGETVEPGDYLTLGPGDRHVQFANVKETIGRISHTGLRSLCLSVMEDSVLSAKLVDAPAAKSMHHNYIGGLVDHIASLMGLGDYISCWYKYGPITKDLLTAAALFHDLAKCEELTWDMGLGYSLEGTLIGHVPMGLMVIDARKHYFYGASPEPENRASSAVLLHLKHIVASHHGRLEWGATKLPMSREAQLFHLMDMIDSRMATYDNIVKEPIDEDGLTAWLRGADGPAWVPR